MRKYLLVFFALGVILGAQTYETFKLYKQRNEAVQEANDVIMSDNNAAVECSALAAQSAQNLLAEINIMRGSVAANKKENHTK